MSRFAKFSRIKTPIKLPRHIRYNDTNEYKNIGKKLSRKLAEYEEKTGKTPGNIRKMHHETGDKGYLVDPEDVTDNAWRIAESLVHESIIDNGYNINKFYVVAENTIGQDHWYYLSRSKNDDVTRFIRLALKEDSLQNLKKHFGTILYVGNCISGIRSETLPQDPRPTLNKYYRYKKTQKLFKVPTLSDIYEKLSI